MSRPRWRKTPKAAAEGKRVYWDVEEPDPLLPEGWVDPLRIPEVQMLELAADLIGYGNLDPEWVYQASLPQLFFLHRKLSRRWKNRWG